MLHYLSSCFLLVVPVLLWNVFLWRRLPQAFQKEIWDDIPRPLSFVESGVRFVVFLFSIILFLEIRTVLQVVGFVIFGIGILVYFASWVPQILQPESRWSKSLLGFCAPAYTPIVWLVGIALIGQHMLFDVWYQYWIYILLSVVFVGVHTLHSVLVYGKGTWKRK